MTDLQPFEQAWFDMLSYTIPEMDGIFQDMADGNDPPVQPEEIEMFRDLIDRYRSSIIEYFNQMKQHVTGATSRLIKYPDFTQERQKLLDILQECCVAVGAPEMFSSKESRVRFKRCTKVLTECIPYIDDLFKRLNTWNLALLSPFHSGSGMQHTKVMPTHLPDVISSVLPWNKWLNNTAGPDSKGPDGDWVALQQKIPRVGEKLFRQITLKYTAYELDFAENELLIPEPDNNEQLPSPGNDFTHMTWSGFSTIPAYHLGFLTGNKLIVDSNGVITLEFLSRLMIKFLDGGTGVELFTDNCPYFRYAMAYQKKNGGQ